MLKVIGSILILLGTTLAGFICGERLKKRVQQLNEIERSVIQLQSEITYVYTPLPEAFIKVAEKSKQPINHIFKNVSQDLIGNRVENVYEAFNGALYKNKDKLYLNNEDIEIILDLTKSLGESDIDGQNNIFSLTLSNLKKQIKIAEMLKNKNLKMYRYLGFTIGAMMVIILI
jgi:stage III sporulation protein AB